jgi:hypothetical protein
MQELALEGVQSGYCGPLPFVEDAGAVEEQVGVIGELALG